MSFASLAALFAFICASTRPVATVDAALIARTSALCFAIRARSSASSSAVRARSSASCSALSARSSATCTALHARSSASPSALIAASSAVCRFFLATSSRVSRSSNAAALAFHVVLLYLTLASTTREVSPRKSTVAIGGETRRGHTPLAVSWSGAAFPRRSDATRNKKNPSAD